MTEAELAAVIMGLGTVPVTLIFCSGLGPLHRVCQAADTGRRKP